MIYSKYNMIQLQKKGLNSNGFCKTSQSVIRPFSTNVLIISHLLVVNFPTELGKFRHYFWFDDSKTQTTKFDIKQYTEVT